MAKKTLYVRLRVVKRDDPGACPECGITAHTMYDMTREYGLSREEVGALADKPEHCPGCGRVLAAAVPYEVEG